MDTRLNTDDRAAMMELLQKLFTDEEVDFLLAIFAFCAGEEGSQLPPAPYPGQFQEGCLPLAQRLQEALRVYHSLRHPGPE